MNKRVLLSCGGAMLVVVSAWSVWPTPYRYHKRGPLTLRENRFTGRIEVLETDGWHDRAEEAKAAAERKRQADEDAERKRREDEPQRLAKQEKQRRRYDELRSKETLTDAEMDELVSLDALVNDRETRPK